MDLDKLAARITKPGVLTTEFFVAVIIAVAGQLTAWGVITPAGNSYAREHVQTWAQLATVAVAIGYPVSRAIAKRSLAPLLALLTAQQTSAGTTTPASPVTIVSGAVSEPPSVGVTIGSEVASTPIYDDVAQQLGEQQAAAPSSAPPAPPVEPPATSSPDTLPAAAPEPVDELAPADGEPPLMG